ncbi:AAA family ATPase [Methanococcoides sp. SA1]|nr:AAA family ATPase [Methanococcoides sp. SA1]
MKVTKVIFENYRNAQKLPLELHPRLNVFVGVNGSGKSTVLDGIAIMLSWAVSRINRSGTSGRGIIESDITNGKSISSIKISCDVDNRDVRWSLVKTRKGHSAREEKSNLQSLSEYTKEIQNKISETSEMVNIPLFDYYPVNRSVLHIPLRLRRNHKFDLLTAYEGSLTADADFKTFFEWFREREDLENENILRHQNIDVDSENFLEDLFNNQYKDPQLEAIRTALSKFLPEFSNLTVRRSPLRMEVKKNGKRLTVNQLSDGEKCLIALIGDLARRLAITNPVSEEPLKGSGIVLIDEVDLHLHPKWQRMIVPKLLDVFPNCQFIISTHSPHVINHVQPECLFLLEEAKSGIVVKKTDESYGKNVDRILEDHMGLKTTRPDEVESALKRIYETIDGGNLRDARELIGDLVQEIRDDPDLVKARVLLRRKELIGK